VLKRSQLWPIAAALIAATCLPAMASAERAAAEVRPVFQMPVPCGEVRQGATYRGHSSHNDWPLDFNRGAGDDDQGDPVLASAAGTVRTWVEADGDRLVRVVHNAEWSSEVRHLSRVDVSNGEHVQPGDQIGLVGKTGNQSSAHLHYEQLMDGVPQRIYFDGAPLNPDYYFRSDEGSNGPSYTSQNCARNFSAVTTISRGVGLMDVFATGSDGVVRHRAWVRDHWSAWVSLTAGMSIKVVGEPAAVTSRAGRIDLFARGADNHLKRLVWTSTSGWGLWQDVDGFITASPAATTRSDTGVDVFARNNAGQIIWRHFNVATNSWSNGWGGLHDKTTSSGPAAVSSPDGTRMNIFARDHDGTLLSLMWTEAHGWYNWVDHEQATMTGRPTASTRAGYTVDVFLRGPDNHLRHWYSPDGAAWDAGSIGDLGGVIFASPASISQNNERIDVFTRNSNGDLIQRIWSYHNSPAGWYPWVGLGPIH
jgi:hypothetical protein